MASSGFSWSISTFELQAARQSMMAVAANKRCMVLFMHRKTLFFEKNFIQMKLFFPDCVNYGVLTYFKDVFLAGRL